jgi:hypothetical protein
MTEHWPHAVEIVLFVLDELRLAAFVIDGSIIPEEAVKIGDAIRVVVPLETPALDGYGVWEGPVEATYLGEVLDALSDLEIYGGVLMGVLREDPGVNMEGKVVGRLDGVTDGVLVRVVRDLTGDVIDDVPDGAVDGVMEGVTDDFMDNVLEGVVESVLDRGLDNVLDDVIDGVMDGVTDSVLEGVVEDVLEVVLDDVLDGVLDKSMVEEGLVV